MLNLLLFVFGLAFLILEAVSVTPAGRVKWGWLGLACWLGSIVLSQAGGLIR